MISFEEKYPKYSRQWDYEKNSKKPSEVSYGSGTKYWWKCSKGHSWISSPNVMSRGVQCPYCSGLYPIKGETDLKTTNPEYLQIWNFEENEKLGIKPENVKRGSKTKVFWKCEKGHTWLAPISRVTIENRGCPYCTNQKVLKGYNDFATKAVNILSEWNYKKNTVKPDEVYYSSTKKIWWICSKCQNEWQASIISRVAKNSGCPECASKKWRQTQLKKQIKNEGSFAENYPELLKEWNYEKNNKLNINPNHYVSKSSKSVHWKCKYGHEWEARISSRTRYKGTGCPICANKTILQGFNDFKTLQPVLMKEWDWKRNNEIQIFPNATSCHSSKKAWWICPICNNNYQATISHRVNGTGCPICAAEMKTSFGEQAIYYYLAKDLKTYNRYNLNGIEVDIYIPELKLGIEYDGELYHKGEQAVKREKNKYEKLKEYEIYLIRVKENFKNNKLIEYSDLTIEIVSKKVEKELENVILKIIKYINENWNLNLETSINIKRDRQEIYDQYINQRKENSVFNIPEFIKDWDYKKNKIKPQNVTKGSGKIVWWICELGHSYESTVNNHVKGSKCPYCKNKKVLRGYNDLLTLKPNLAKEWNYERNEINPQEVVIGSNKIVWWKCCECAYEWKAKIADRSKRNSKCPMCHYKKTQ